MGSGRTVNLPTVSGEARFEISCTFGSQWVPGTRLTTTTTTLSKAAPGRSHPPAAVARALEWGVPVAGLCRRRKCLIRSIYCACSVLAGTFICRQPSVHIDPRFSHFLVTTVEQLAGCNNLGAPYSARRNKNTFMLLRSTTISLHAPTAAACCFLATTQGDMFYSPPFVHPSTYRLLAFSEQSLCPVLVFAASCRH